MPVRGRVGHRPTEEPGVLDFSTTANYRTPDGTARVFESSLSTARTYPSNDYLDFRAAAASAIGCEATQIIPVGGGFAAMRLCLGVTVTAGDAVLFPKPSFIQYAVEARLQGIEPSFAPASELLHVDPSPYDVVVVQNPNNPTGNGYDRGDLRAFVARCREVDTVVVVNETHLPFADRPTVAPLEGAIVFRSLGEVYGMPGVPVGFCVATDRLRDRLDVARLTWGLGAPAAALGEFWLESSGFVAESRERIRSERARMRDRLGTRFDVRQSEGAFLLVDMGDPDAVDSALVRLRDRDIAVCDARVAHGLDHHVRVGVRAPDDNDRLLEALEV